MTKNLKAMFEYLTFYSICEFQCLAYTAREVFLDETLRVFYWQCSYHLQILAFRVDQVSIFCDFLLLLLYLPFAERFCFYWPSIALGSAVISVMDNQNKIGLYFESCFFSKSQCPKFCMFQVCIMK